MKSFNESMQIYRRQLAQGDIQIAYRGLMDYILSLRTGLKNKYPDYATSGSIYCGYMDMTYFAFTPPVLKTYGLKIAIVFAHEAFRFEIWLAGTNKQIQAQFWHRMKQSDWQIYPIVPSVEGRDAVIEHVLVEEPDFNDLDALTAAIELGTLKFIHEVEHFLSSSG